MLTSVLVYTLNKARHRAYNNPNVDFSFGKQP